MSTTARILVATHVVADADLVKKLLRDEFDNVAVSTVAERAAEDFDKHRPEVLILAFDTLEQCERYYLGLYRRSTSIHTQPHRTLILCNKNELQRVYELCKKGSFDDYVLFWPLTHDAPRLPMAVHHALRQLAASAAGGPTVAEFAAQARRLALLEPLLKQYAAGFQREIDRLNADEIATPLDAVGTAAQPSGDWAIELEGDLAQQLQAARDLQSLADRVRPLLLMVDDDPYQHKLLGAVLRDANLDLDFATSGTEALALLSRRRPDLILMDVDLPDIDGVETTRRIKAVERLAGIPVVMLTGHGDKDVVVRSIKAGASGFLVKPLNKDTLLAKIRSCLNGA